MRALLAAVAIALFPALSTTAVAAETMSAIGRKIDDFALQDFRGKEHRLAELADAKAVVVAFIGTECPLAKLYGPRLAEMAREFRDRGVAFVAIDSNRQDSITELAAFARVHDIDFPLLRDSGNAVADQFSAERTPEVFLLDADRVVRYRGRVDDQYSFTTGVGYARAKVERADLREAITELLDGRAVSVPETEAVGCIIGRVREPNEASEVTYSNQIARLFQARCVECHREGQIGPFTLSSYEDAAGWAEMIDEVVRERRMPPWHADPRYGKFSNDYSLSQEEIDLVREWARNGAPEGDPAQLPDPVEFSGGWMLPGGPEQIFYMRDKPYDVPAEGVVEYQYFEVDPGFTEDKWIQAAECMPGNRGVVHHIIVFIRTPDGTPGDIAAFGHLTGFAPGTRPIVLPEGTAKFVPAGSKLIFQLHYTPNGSPQQDRSAVGVKFANAANVQRRAATLNAGNQSFAIPPHADNHQVEAERRFAADVELISLFPHMHLRGKAFKYEVVYPDGGRETLLDVPRYDFNWQNHFVFAEPKKLPKGSVLHCTAHFDNSENNLANPDPDTTVRWGDQTWEEMMLGWFDMTVPAGQSLAEAVPEQMHRFRNRRRGSPRGESGE